MALRTGEFELPQEAWVADSFGAQLRSEVVTQFPVWTFGLYAVLLLNCALTNFSPPQTQTAWTVMFPLAVFVFMVSARAARAPNVPNRLLLALFAFGVSIIFPVLNLAFHRPSPVQGPTLLVFYELSNFLWAGLMMWHAAAKGRQHLALFFGAALVYGACLENGGIWLGFFDESALSLSHIPGLPAPMATMLGWSVVLYMGTFVVWRLREYFPLLRSSNALSAVLVATVATALDLQIDPLATAAGAWVWHGSLQPFFHGVPLLNFVAWMSAITPFAYAMFRVQEQFGARDGSKWSNAALVRLTLLAPFILLMALICFSGTMYFIEGPGGPAWSIFYEASDRILHFVGVL
jgi:hypothetical protein